MLYYYDSYESVLARYQDALYDKTKAAEQARDQKFVAGNATAELRARLIEEESAELVYELRYGTILGVLKEICDVIVVTIGTAVIYGLPIRAAFNRTNDNNLSRIETGTVREDGKLVKHPDHPKVKLEDLVDGY